jgi:hypothetical protein
MHLPVRKLRKSVRLLDLECSCGLPGRPVGKTKVADLAAPNDRVERCKRFFEWRKGILAMDDTEIDPVRVEALQSDRLEPARFWIPQWQV